ncbi:MAG: hypothetical protein VST66_03500 [Nitrospirota bacterium]|nr:hypothetical protein [Nitrospirota bacterium]
MELHQGGRLVPEPLSMVGSNRIKGHLMEVKGVLKGSVRYRQMGGATFAVCVPTSRLSGIVNLSQIWLIGHVKRTAESLII